MTLISRTAARFRSGCRFASRSNRFASRSSRFSIRPSNRRSARISGRLSGRALDHRDKTRPESGHLVVATADRRDRCRG